MTAGKAEPLYLESDHGEAVRPLVFLYLMKLPYEQRKCLTSSPRLMILRVFGTVNKAQFFEIRVKGNLRNTAMRKEPAQRGGHLPIGTSCHI